MARMLARLIATMLLALTAAAAHAQSGCTLTAGTTQTIAIAASGRSTLVHVPAGLDPTRPAPLVLLLHGSGGRATDILRESKLADTADRDGFILVAPDAGVPTGKGFAWNIPGVPTVSGKVPGSGAADDVGYLKAIIDQFVTSHCADPARVYVTGLSGGGRMASWMACVDAGRIAAIAPVVGLRAGNPWPRDYSRPNPATCRPSRPMPILAFAGDHDTTNPIDGGGAGYWRYSMHAAEGRWAALDRCTAAPITRWVKPGVYDEVYAGCANKAEVIGRISVGETHHWIADNDAMWAFFSRYRS